MSSPVAFNTRSLDPIPNKRKKLDGTTDTNLNLAGQNITLYDNINFADKLFTNQIFTGSTPGSDDYELNSSTRNKTQSVMVPIGTWGVLQDGDCNESVIATDIIHWEGNQNQPQKLPEDVATYCSGQLGSNNPFEMSTIFPLNTDLPDYGISPTPHAIEENVSLNDQVQVSNATYVVGAQNDPFDIFPDQDVYTCGVGKKTVARPNQTNCYNGGVHYPSFCQLGDYVFTVDECEGQCSNVLNSNTNNKNYCHHAKDRVCGKTKQDPIRIGQNGALINSDRDWIMTQECIDYCGPANIPSENMSVECDENKRHFCGQPEGYTSDTDAKLNYCKDYLKTNFSEEVLDRACTGLLIDPEGENNITGNTGCAELCPSGDDDIDHDYCNNTRAKYCEGSFADGSKTLLTTYCYDFCSDNPNRCEDNLRTSCDERVRAIPGIADKLDNNIELSDEDVDKIEDLMDIIVDSQGRQLGNYCGCFLPQRVYDRYIEKRLKRLVESGIDVDDALSSLNTNPECIYPRCNTGIQTEAQKNGGNCQTCLQNVLLGLNDSQVGNCIIINNLASCYQQDDSIPIENETDLEKIKVENNCVTDEGIIGNIDVSISTLLIGIFVGLFLLIVVVVSFLGVRKHFGSRSNSPGSWNTVISNPHITF